MKRIFVIFLTAIWLAGCTGMPTQTAPTEQQETSTVSAIPKKGDTGKDVETLQKALNKKGAVLTVDGDFGSVTLAAVSKFQKENGLEGSGEIGPKTMELLGLRVGASLEPEVPVTPDKPTDPATPGEASFSKKYPSTGWHSDFDDYVETNVTVNMISQGEARMAKVCPQWGSMNETQRREFWADFMFSVIKPESNYKWASMYWEEGQGVDSVTGLRVKTSEGPLQLSYSDVQAYGAACDFQYQSHDREYHLQDIANKPASKSWLSKFPQEKYILHPVRNIHCGIAIMDKLLKNPSLSSIEFSDLLGRYWAVMRRGKNPESYAQVVKQMKSRGSVCAMQ